MLQTRKIVHSMNYQRPKNEEKNTGESLTQPDMSLSIQDLLLYHTRNGHWPENSIKQQFYTDDIVPNPKAMDLVDLQERRMELEFQQQSINEQIASQSAATTKTKKAAKPKEEIPAEGED